MRKIEFRGRSLKGNWCYGDLLQSTDKIYIKTKSKKEEVDPETVSQKICYKDDILPDIYEGDILEYEEYGTHKGVFTYDRDCFSFYIHRITSSNTYKVWFTREYLARIFEKKSGKIIGNIYNK